MLNGEINDFRRVKVCQHFCDELYKHCKDAEFNGNNISKNFCFCFQMIY